MTHIYYTYPMARWPGQVKWDCYEIWIESYELENKFKKISNELLDNDLVQLQ